jgi:hypothetical protein
LSDAPNVLCQLVHSPNFEVTAKVNLKLEKGDCCGLVITGGNYYGLRFENSVNGFYLKAVSYEYDSSSDADTSENIMASVKIDEAPKLIYLKLKMEYPGNISMYYSYDGNEFTRLELDTACSYKVSRKSWVGARMGIFCVNMEHKNSEGYADFEYFKVD